MIHRRPVTFALISAHLSSSVLQHEGSSGSINAIPHLMLGLSFSLPSSSLPSRLTFFHKFVISLLALFRSTLFAFDMMLVIWPMHPFCIPLVERLCLLMGTSHSIAGFLISKKTPFSEVATSFYLLRSCSGLVSSSPIVGSHLILIANLIAIYSRPLSSEYDEPPSNSLSIAIALKDLSH